MHCLYVVPPRRMRPGGAGEWVNEETGKAGDTPRALTRRARARRPLKDRLPRPYSSSSNSGAHMRMVKLLSWVNSTSFTPMP